MAESPTWRRRIASIGVLALAAGALIATSPPALPSSTLDANFRASPQLSAAVPRITGLVTLDLSDAVLPRPGDDRVRVSGLVAFRTISGGFRMDVRPVGVALPGASDAADEPMWSIETLCRAAEPCHREFEVTLQLLGAGSGDVVDADFEATLEILYQEIDANPEGAEASWSGSAGLEPVPAPAATRQ